MTDNSFKTNFNLMPFQLSPMNGDSEITDEMIRLRDKFNIKTAIECGTCLGGTAVFFAENFDKTFTIEINPDYLSVAVERIALKGLSEKIHPYLGDSATVLPDLFKLYSIGDNTLILIDDHWLGSIPIFDELEAIKEHGIKPVLVFHDFKNPNDDRFGFDSYNGVDFTYEWIKPHLDSIYGENNYNYYFNTGFKEESAKRGVLFCTPKTELNG